VFRSKPEIGTTKDRLTETWESARGAIAPQLTAARGAVAPYVEEATTRMAPVIDQARAKVAPAVGTAIDRIGPAVDSARGRLRDDVAPVVVAAVETARETSAPARAEAKERAANALLALQGQQKKVRRWPVAVACLAAGAVAGAAAGVLTRSQRPKATAAFPAPTPFPTNSSHDAGLDESAQATTASERNT
jgi:hypothetical protein